MKFGEGFLMCSGQISFVRLMWHFSFCLLNDLVPPYLLPPRDLLNKISAFCPPCLCAYVPASSSSSLDMAVWAYSQSIIHIQLLNQSGTIKAMGIFLQLNASILAECSTTYTYFLPIISSEIGCKGYTEFFLPHVSRSAGWGSKYPGLLILPNNQK